MTDWLVYRCEQCAVTTYVNAAIVDTFQPKCGHALCLVGLADEREFCAALKGCA